MAAENAATADADSETSPGAYITPTADFLVIVALSLTVALAGAAVIFP